MESSPANDAALLIIFSEFIIPAAEWVWRRHLSSRYDF